MDWHTRDGRVIPIREMEDKHLLNTIALYRRRYSAWIFWRSMHLSLTIHHYAETAPDGAAMAAESEAAFICTGAGRDQLLAEELSMFRALLSEAARRRSKKQGS